MITPHTKTFLTGEVVGSLVDARAIPVEGVVREREEAGAGTWALFTFIVGFFGGGVPGEEESSGGAVLEVPCVYACVSGKREGKDCFFFGYVYVSRQYPSRVQPSVARHDVSDSITFGMEFFGRVFECRVLCFRQASSKGIPHDAVQDKNF
jgi:hypothetical protein